MPSWACADYLWSPAVPGSRHAHIAADGSSLRSRGRHVLRPGCRRRTGPRHGNRLNRRHPVARHQRRGREASTVRLVTADATRVEVLQGATPVGNFLRSLFTTIVVDAGGGDDTVLIDEINGAFTDTESTLMDGADGNDTIRGDRRRGHPGRGRHQHDQPTARQRRDVRWRRRRPVHLEPRRRQRHRRGAGRDRHAGVPRQQRARTTRWHRTARARC